MDVLISELPEGFHPFPARARRDASPSLAPHLVDRRSSRSTSTREKSDLGPQPRQVEERTHFGRAEARAGVLRRDANGLVARLGHDQEVPAQHLVGLGIRTVGDRPPIAAHPNARRRRRGMQRGGAQIAARFAQPPAETRGLGACRGKRLGTALPPCFLVVVAEQQERLERRPFGGR